MKRALLGTLAALMLVFAAPAGAITFGQLDTTNRYPYVGALIGEFDGVKEIVCSGTLVQKTPGNPSSNVFLTAGHCTAFLDSIGSDVWVTFNPEWQPGFDESLLIPGTSTTHEGFGVKGGGSDPHDIAVVELDRNVSGAARLPRPNFLNTIALRNQRFTAVGYGTVREDKTGGPHSLFFDGKRRYAEQSFRSMNKPWLNLSMNPSTGSGGTCFGDSGGPHFLGPAATTNNLVVSLTVTGDRFCRATDVTYRVDTASARAFLDDFVTLPS